VECEIKNGEWLFSVADNGIGFDQSHSDLVFEPFQRLHGREKYPGNGIGLPICKRIVERHGGNIWVESKIGAGTNFYFTINRRLPNSDPQPYSGIPTALSGSAHGF
jgi:light-regulated signal transduction histidine kinase (bacteriophytochrome)